jgi:diguanylate cyclase (GGDEF)-like protein
MQGSDNDEKPDARRGSHHDVSVAMKIGVAALAAPLLWCAIWLLLENAPLGSAAAIHLSVPTLILATVALLVYRENRKWRAPSRQLKEILEGCRSGERPIEELKTVSGGMTELALVAQQLLHDLRQQKRVAAELENELRQRVAHRTSALERQMSSLRVQATRDALTGLYNRRMLEECLPKMIQECRTSNNDLSVLAIDVDNFKPLNDSLGHAVGDEFLRSIAQILRSGVRECDAAIRCGGDEFIVLLPGCSLPAARALADRLTAVVESLAKTIKSPIPPGISVGTASLMDLTKAATLELAVSSLLQAADKHLYLKKASRKRRVA